MADQQLRGTVGRPASTLGVAHRKYRIVDVYVSRRQQKGQASSPGILGSTSPVVESPRRQAPAEPVSPNGMRVWSPRSRMRTTPAMRVQGTNSAGISRAHSMRYPFTREVSRRTITPRSECNPRRRGHPSLPSLESQGRPGALLSGIPPRNGGPHTKYLYEEGKKSSVLPTQSLDGCFGDSFDTKTPVKADSARVVRVHSVFVDQTPTSAEANDAPGWRLFVATTSSPCRYAAASHSPAIRRAPIKSPIRPRCMRKYSARSDLTPQEDAPSIDVTFRLNQSLAERRATEHLTQLQEGKDNKICTPRELSFNEVDVTTSPKTVKRRSQSPKKETLGARPLTPHVGDGSAEWYNKRGGDATPTQSTSSCTASQLSGTLKNTMTMRCSVKEDCGIKQQEASLVADVPTHIDSLGDCTNSTKFDEPRALFSGQRDSHNGSAEVARAMENLLSTGVQGIPSRYAGEAPPEAGCQTLASAAAPENSSRLLNRIKYPLMSLPSIDSEQQITYGDDCQGFKKGACRVEESSIQKQNGTKTPTLQQDCVTVTTTQALTDNNVYTGGVGATGFVAIGEKVTAAPHTLRVIRGAVVHDAVPVRRHVDGLSRQVVSDGLGMDPVATDPREESGERTTGVFSSNVQDTCPLNGGIYIETKDAINLPLSCPSESGSSRWGMALNSTQAPETPLAGSDIQPASALSDARLCSPEKADKTGSSDVDTEGDAEIITSPTKWCVRCSEEAQRTPKTLPGAEAIAHSLIGC
ncbi:hypothetical protein TRVL_07048 [Trypanosoma vivax]|nr:hypothetical protein TRVL_07048 [Trypanosoma vivax]